jgi:hypothetical protein
MSKTLQTPSPANERDGNADDASLGMDASALCVGPDLLFPRNGLRQEARMTLDELDRLEKEAVKMLEDAVGHQSRAEAEMAFEVFKDALADFWQHSGGREMVMDGLELRRIKELARDNNRLMAELIEKHAARIESELKG